MTFVISRGPESLGPPKFLEPPKLLDPNIVFLVQFFTTVLLSMLPEVKKQCIGTKCSDRVLYATEMSALSPVAVTLAGFMRYSHHEREYRQ